MQFETERVFKMIKFCERPFQSIHLDPNGGCRLCAWTNANLGDLTKEDLETVWKSENANKIREAVKQGNYEFCRKTSCPFLENDSLPEISEEDAEKIVPEELPIEYSVACDFICNHSCPSCRNDIFRPDEEYKVRLQKILGKILPYLNRKETTKILTDGNGDCFASPYIMNMLEHLHPENEACQIAFETNGALLDEVHWERIKHLARYDVHITVTPNSFIRSTFTYLNGGHDSYDDVMRNLAFLRSLREKGDVNWIRISIVLQERNFWEFPEFARRCLEEFAADEVVAKPLYRWFMLSQEDYWFKDVLNPRHPYHKEYLEMLDHPVLKDPRIFYWGAHNLHTEREHPAYLYKEHMRIVEMLLDRQDVAQALQKCLHEKGVSTLYIYGDMELASVLYRVLSKTDIELKGFMARDIVKGERCGQKVKCLHDYEPQDADAVLVLNDAYMEEITRDFHFQGFYGRLLPINELIEGMDK